MFEVWRGHGGKAHQGPRFRLLADAIRHVYAQKDGGTYAIRTPEGKWHHFAKSGGVTLRRIRSSGVFERLSEVARKEHAG